LPFHLRSRNPLIRLATGLFVAMVWLMGIAAVKLGCYWFFSGFDMHAFLLLREPEKDSAISNLEFLLMCALGIGYSLVFNHLFLRASKRLGRALKKHLVWDEILKSS